MRVFLHVLPLLGLLFSGSSWAWAEEKSGFSGTLSLEVGGTQAPSNPVQSYSYYHLLAREAEDLAPDLSFCLAGEANWQTYTPSAQISWPLYSPSNLLNLEGDNFSSPLGNDFLSLQMDRAYLHWATGRLTLTAGLFKPQWGAGLAYKPTDYFFPLSPLQWQREPALGSEGADATLFLLDDLTLEGAVRWLQGGDAEGVLRLVEKGIGISFTPSLAWMDGRNGVGLEAVGTFPNLQVRLEGVDWLYGDGHTNANWVAGLSTSHEGVKYTAELLRDGTGEILGSFSGEVSQATYVFISMDGSFFEKWKASPALVAALEGGPFLLWPKVEWDFAPQWSAGFQGQFLLGNWKGPLDLFPGRAGLSVAYSF